MSEPIPAQPTRHQLDELDALMQRMLELPVHQTPDDPLPLPTEFVETMKPEPVRLVISPPRAASVRESFVTTNSVETPAETEQLAIKPTAVRESTTFTPIKRSLTTEEKTAAPTLQRQRRPSLWYLQPLIWSNRVFDRGVGRFGRTGRWMRSSRGRAALGWTGLLFLAAALAIVLLDTMGWTW